MSQAMLDFHVDCPRPDLVLVCNAQGVLRLLSILIENAVKYTPPGGAVTMRAMPASCLLYTSVKGSISVAVKIGDWFHVVDAAAVVVVAVAEHQAPALVRSEAHSRR